MKLENFRIDEIQGDLLKLIVGNHLNITDSRRLFQYLNNKYLQLEEHFSKR